ncbi:MAG: thioredoxin domain-containing protein [Thioploca sp.]|nr:thioredoxin domain-containing protein [Thioploca sp.]
MSMTHTNALINETSPYLLQHAHNPVHWYPWGQEALALAKQQNKPILLSIGYSACHWCHVMAHESFENSQTASIMNELFINIKVDREERPDLDKIYQMAHQLLVQRPGGWPLTMFLSPEDQYPFFGGTYFPPQPRYGMPAFSELLKKVAAFYRQYPQQVIQHQQALIEAFTRDETTITNPEQQLDAEPLNQARDELAQNFDRNYGGFGQAPKFPHLFNIERLLHHYQITTQQGNPDEEGLEMAILTLKKMALGGIYDQLGGGFCRYSVDEAWTIPHFEKMLYDNGPFLTLYSEAWQLTHQPLFETIALEIAAWVLREMRALEGGFYSTLDADSEGEEGKFYLWTRDQIRELLNENLYSPFAYYFGLNRPANFEGHWHLHVYHELEETAQHFNLPVTEMAVQLEQAKTVLFQNRQQRTPPGRDDKMLTAWNALMIKGLATAGRIFARPDYLRAAEQALDFIKNKLWTNGHLLVTYKAGQAKLNGYLDDYALLLDAILSLLQARWRDGDLDLAIALAEVLLTEFADTKQGGFYFTAHHHESLILRPKSFEDDSLPSGNGVAALALGRLGHILGEQRYLQAAEQTLQASWSLLQQSASYHATLLSALEDYLFPPQIIILRGEPEVLTTWQTVCQQAYAPHRFCLAIPNSVRDLPGLLAEKQPQGSAVAYVCTGPQCHAPIISLAELKKELEAK